MWLFIPSQFVPAELPGSTLDSESLARDLARSVTWKGKKRPAKLWLRDLKTGPSKRLLYGRISQHSMGLGFAAWLASCVPDSPANPTASPASAAVTPMSGPSGQNLYEWWERCSRRWFSSKMFLSFFDTSDQLERSYRDWATGLRSRYSLRLPMSARAIDDSESLSWPTAMAAGAKAADHYARGNPSLIGAVRAWKTPHGMGNVDH